MCSGMKWRSWALVVGLLALPYATLGQMVPPVGTDATFDVATWNIEWFGSTSNGPSDDDGQFDRVVETILGAEIDLWAVQEIADTDVFDDLMAALGDGYEGHLATNSTSQRIGYIFNTDVVRLRSLDHILESFEFEFASRPPLQLEADVTLGDTTVVITFITVHMKAFGDLASYNRRLDAGQRLKNHIDFSTLNREAVVVLGDFNDELTDSITGGQDTPYENFLSDPNDYLFLSLELEEAGEPTFIGSSNSNLDHILITNELFTHFVPGTIDTMDNLESLFPGYEDNTSDHLPVTAQFSFPVVLNTPVRLTVVDVLGRIVYDHHVGFAGAGPHEATLSLPVLPAGVYLFRLATPHHATSRRLVRQ